MTILNGVYAALLTPRNRLGNLDVERFHLQLEMPAAKELSGYAINGATGEFICVSDAYLKRELELTQRHASDKQILVGIGAGDVDGAILRGKIAADHGAAAVLLPMPGFFPYRQDDLKSFVLTVSHAVPLPVILYNLPQFTTGLEPQTVLDLLQADTNIIGIKDSSGSLDILRAITHAKLPAARLIGNDSALRAAMEEEVCDGVVSGVACALPELMTRIFSSTPGSEGFMHDWALLDEFIKKLSQLPTPWGLKVVSELRGFTHASFPFPLSSERRAEIESLRDWSSEWIGQCCATGV
jgi:4-hydroxy-tetrahydrodipicolinate synthase